PKKALDESRKAVELAQGTGALEATAWNALGVAHRELGDFTAAESDLERARAISRASEDLGREAYVALELARVARDRGDLDAVLRRIQPAIDIIESLRTRVSSPDLRAVFLATKQEYYELYIHTLMDLHRDALALQASERARP